MFTPQLNLLLFLQALKSVYFSFRRVRNHVSTKTAPTVFYKPCLLRHSIAIITCTCCLPIAPCEILSCMVFILSIQDVCTPITKISNIVHETITLHHKPKTQVFTWKQLSFAVSWLGGRSTISTNSRCLPHLCKPRPICFSHREQSPFLPLQSFSSSSCPSTLYQSLN